MTLNAKFKCSTRVANSLPKLHLFRCHPVTHATIRAVRHALFHPQKSHHPSQPRSPARPISSPAISPSPTSSAIARSICSTSRSHHPPSPQRHQAHQLRPRLQSLRHHQPRAPPRRTFLARPRTEGLWLRLTFTTGELLEGLAPIDITLLDDLVNDAGLFLIPPDTRSNTQRLYVPRTSIAELALLAVITSPSKKKPTPTPPNPQQDLFNTNLPSNARPN